jgi:hypothetical protein
MSATSSFNVTLEHTLGYLKFLLSAVKKKSPPPSVLFYIGIAMDQVVLKDGQKIK